MTPPSPRPVTCLVQYEIDPNRHEAFEQYARCWTALINRYGGTHHGYFIAEDAPTSATLSFPGIGREGPLSMAFALFSFPSHDVYERYRRAVRDDPDCIAAEELVRTTQCFTSYERSFVRRLAGA